MEKPKQKGIKTLKCILGILTVVSFLFFILGQACLEPENISESSTCREFQAEWVELLPDGSEQPVSVPGTCVAKRGEWVTIATTLPQHQEETWICVRSMQQDMKIYVGDELRKEYSTLDTQLFGKTSTMTYVFFQVYEADAGEQLRIEFMTDSSYAGYVSDMYEGALNDINRHFYGMYTPSAITAAFMLLIGLFVISASAFVRIFYKREVDLFYLGVVIVLASTWLLVESKLRQFFFPNSTIAMQMGFLMVALLPYPFMMYLDGIQKGRYRKAYMTLSTCTALNYIIVVTLQVLGIKDFFETMTSSHVILLVLILLMVVTFVLDIVKGYVREYREVAIGFLGLMLAGVFEIGLAYIVEAQLNGIALCVGLVLLLFASGLKTIRDLLNVEKEKQTAVAAGEAKAKFLANMSHEIRTPINTVLGMNEMILRDNKDETVEGYAINIKRAGQMLLSLVNEILDFSKIEAGKLKIVEDDYRLAAMLQDIILGVEVRIKQKNLTLKLEIDETMPAVVKGDEIRVKQILNNLLSNAIKYTEKGTITFSAKGLRSEEGFVLCISVADTGMGIKKEDMEALFASFQRLELTKNRYIEGTGLGLNITKQLVNLMNGTIQVESEYGEGSCFTIQLPQQIVDDTAMGKLGQKAEKAPGEKGVQKSILRAPDAKLLIVDDTPMNLTVIGALLKRTEIQLDFATGGNECLQKTREKKYDLILMDHMMPEPDGIQTLHMLREDTNNLNKDVDVIVLTANAIEGMREEYLEEGFADYLSKPVRGDVLEEILAKFLKDLNIV
ncbi:MAG: response regulator [Lachnospiraceae bacterium]|nr:response regulator [Lachnospiraceae bacterium]